MANSIEKCRDARIAMKIPQRFQKCEKRILQYFFTICRIIYFRPDIGGQFRGVSPVKYRQRFPVSSQYLTNQECIIGEFYHRNVGKLYHTLHGSHKFMQIDRTAQTAIHYWYMERVYAAVEIGNEFPSLTRITSIGGLLSVIVPNAFMLAGVLAFLLLVFAGFGMIQAAGSGDTKQMESGKKAITGAVIGLLVIIGSFWIIQIIETLTGMKGQILPPMR